MSHTSQVNAPSANEIRNLLLEKWKWDEIVEGNWSGTQQSDFYIEKILPSRNSPGYNVRIRRLTRNLQKSWEATDAADRAGDLSRLVRETEELLQDIQKYDDDIDEILLGEDQEEDEKKEKINLMQERWFRESNVYHRLQYQSIGFSIFYLEPEPEKQDRAPPPSPPHDTSMTFKTTLPSDELGHSPPRTQLPASFLRRSVAIPLAQRTHDFATTGGMADLHGSSLASLPEETRIDESRAGLVGGLGHSVRGTKDLSSAPTSFKDVRTTSTAPRTFGADSQASTRTLHGSIVERNEQERENEKQGVVRKTKDTLKKAEEKAVEKVPGVGSKDGNATSTSASRDVNSTSTSGAGDMMEAAAAGSTVAGISYPATTTGPSGVTAASHGSDTTRREFASSTTSSDNKLAGAMKQLYVTSTETHTSSSPATSSIPPPRRNMAFKDKSKGMIKVLCGSLGMTSRRLRKGDG
ncbi:hypothetical protein BDQ17DRAFT_1360210 [Cyathus striatus]|nr:hypothetical protein BDQ17DRAFT_1360210 [Cyathus striatus]